MEDNQIEVDAAVVVSSGQEVAGLAGGWREWGTRCRTGFGDAGAAVGNARLAWAVAEYATRWNPVVQRVASQVDTLGSNVVVAGNGMDGTDVTAAQLVAGQHRAIDGCGSLLSRPVHM